MCQWWVLLGLEVLCSDVSGVDTAILFHPTMQPCMISSSGSAPLKKKKVWDGCFSDKVCLTMSEITRCRSETEIRQSFICEHEMS